MYELDILTEKFNKENREAWERARFISYVTAQTQSYKKKYKLTDIIKFAWDDEAVARVESYEEVAERMKLFQKRVEENKNSESKIAKFN